MIVVTGGAGFIGSNIVADLNEAGRGDILVCDWLGSGDKWRNLRNWTFADFASPPELLERLAGRTDLEAVIHMGAISSTTAANGDEMIERNFRFSLRLLDLCTAAGVPFLYASSAAVYGDGAQGFEDGADPDRIRALRPLNLYGWSKRQFDFVVADRMARSAPLPPLCAGFRFFNVFGPNEYHKGDMRSLAAKIAGPASRGETVSLFKSGREDIPDGGQRRDFVYVRDAVRAVLSFLRPDAPSGIFNIGTGRARSFCELAEAVFRAFGREPAIAYADMPPGLEGRYQYFTQAPLGRLREAGFTEAFPPLEQSVAEYIDRYLSRPEEDRYR